jgi:hypothetical protein
MMNTPKSNTSESNVEVPGLILFAVWRIVPVLVVD